MSLAALDAPSATGPDFRVHSRGDRYVVIDDLLPQADFDAAADERIRLKPVLSTIDPVYDGFAYRGGEERQALGDTAPDAPRWQRAVKEQISAHLDLLDATGRADHISLTLSAWGYPAGSRLSWHNDAGAGRIGAYVYFTHRTWNTDWGGGLALIDEASRADALDGAALLQTAKHPALILPRPNRLVIFRAHTMHAIQRVDTTAGDRMRRTWTGFITTKDTP
ncbi:2OG-Fe(II) oxygenase [Streptomyces sp. NPDC058682]|uniref:2OG-Fe(II) oxygenase n=1 Tax=unclassified Streptomyces TaxID=2593676 RepID=UPI00224DF7EA|nr:2OG-Fe(II) oxygenase [Streptomyces sp. NBC_01214]MCX4801341.1 2OG-Fe(II) oxygenase [Streptomyces sp. NBC_01214]